MSSEEISRLIRWYRWRIWVMIGFVLLDASCLTFLLVSGLAFGSAVAALTSLGALLLIWVGALQLVGMNRQIRRLRVYFDCHIVG